MDTKTRRQIRFSGVHLILAVSTLVGLHFALARSSPREVPYSEIVDRVREGAVEEAWIEENRLVVALRDDEPGRLLAATRVPGTGADRLVEELERHGAHYSGRVEEEEPWWLPLLLGWVLPLIVLSTVYTLAMRRLGQGVGPLSFGRSRVKIHDRNESEPVTFADVAGVDEAKAELVEVVDFLRSPDRYRALGARIPKGVLLVGPPGTGKTLLARAVAGEARTPFFSLSGSDFVEMFVGVGAARVRDLFEQAKQRAPCIVFIDELDALGKARGGVGALATHDEREQTLNQLLVEMDGFEPGRGVVIMAATNRPEILDPALLRAGRFDRRILVDRPDVQGRRAILDVHARRIALAPGTSLDVVAQRTPGMAGADLANVVNEAALAAARRGGENVTLADFETAIDRLQLGLEQRGRVFTDRDRRRVATHESGHAVVALGVEHADPVHRVTIIPRSIGALGATLQLPAEERLLMTRAELFDRLCVLLGGRAAERLVLGDVSTGAQDDLSRATDLARQMVCRFGMSDALGPVVYGHGRGPRFLVDPLGSDELRGHSNAVAERIDAEVRDLVERADARAREILERDRSAVERVAAALLERETLDRAELVALTAAVGRQTERTVPASERRVSARMEQTEAP